MEHQWKIMETQRKIMEHQWKTMQNQWTIMDDQWIWMNMDYFKNIFWHIYIYILTLLFGVLMVVFSPQCCFWISLLGWNVVQPVVGHPRTEEHSSHKESPLSWAKSHHPDSFYNSMCILGVPDISAYVTVRKHIYQGSIPTEWGLNPRVSNRYTDYPWVI